MNYDQARTLLQTEKQSHLLNFWDALDAPKQCELLSDIASVDWKLLRRARDAAHDPADPIDPKTCSAPSVVAAPATPQEHHEFSEAKRIGQDLLRQQRVAALTVAGGQGIRLGFDGPKGCLPITPVRQKSLFEHFAECILACNRRFGGSLPWLIMTSPLNDGQTKEFFERHAFFGLPQSNVHFFQQGTLPALDPDGKALLASKHRLALSPDGHGGTLRALGRSGLLQEMQARKVQYLSYFQIDNPLIHAVDPIFIGLVHQRGVQVGSKVVPKRDAAERVGVFVESAGKVRVVEYTVLPTEMAERRDGQGKLVFDQANIAAHVFDVSFVSETVSATGSPALPWYSADKAVAHIDPATGACRDASTYPTYKLEQFIFDAIPLAGGAMQYQVARRDEFSPVKNASGPDSAATSQDDMVAKAQRWLTQCGMELSPGERTDQRVEISPLFALDVEELMARAPSSFPRQTTEDIYLGP